MNERICAVDGCTGLVTPKTARGMCKLHYGRWLRSNPDRHRTEQDRRPDSNYPPDDELVRLAGRLGSVKAVACAVGVRRESLRDFLDARPMLRARVVETIQANQPTAEQRLATKRQHGREYQRSRRAVDPEGARQARREQMRKYDADYRHRWNHHNRLRRAEIDLPDAESREYAAVLRGDPCCYCGAPMNEVDHIDPIVIGGTGKWDNLTAACSNCNRRKHTHRLLTFLLNRLDQTAV